MSATAHGAKAAPAVTVTGMECPMPLSSARNMMKVMAPGETIELVATDPDTIRRLQVYAQTCGHEVMESHRDGGNTRIVLRKGQD